MSLTAGQMDFSSEYDHSGKREVTMCKYKPNSELISNVLNQYVKDFKNYLLILTTIRDREDKVFVISLVQHHYSNIYCLNSILRLLFKAFCSPKAPNGHRFVNLQCGICGHSV